MVGSGVFRIGPAEKREAEVIVKSPQLVSQVLTAGNIRRQAFDTDLFVEHQMDDGGQVLGLGSIAPIGLAQGKRLGGQQQGAHEGHGKDGGKNDPQIRSEPRQGSEGNHGNQQSNQKADRKSAVKAGPGDKALAETVPKRQEV